MIIDQLIRQKNIGISDKTEDMEVIDITLALDEKGKINTESLGTIELSPSKLFVNKAPEDANDTIKWMKLGMDGKLLTPFKGIPYKNNKTSVKTLLKIAWTIYKAPHFSQKLVDLGSIDLEERQENALKILWKTKEKPNGPDSTFKNSEGIKLPCIGKTAQGWVILGLTSPTGDPKVDDLASIEITESLWLKEKNDPNEDQIKVVDFSLHVNDGLGRNNFGKAASKTKNKFDPSEYARIFGIDAPVDISLLQSQYSNYLRYPMRVAPVPDSSHLAFFCKNEEDYKYTKRVLSTLREERYKKKETTEDNVQIQKRTIHTFPDVGDRKVTIALICPETGNKTKTIVSEIFPSIPLFYWTILESQLSTFKIDLKINEFNKVIVNGPKGEASPASYKMWTKSLTNLLNGIKISPESFWEELPKYHKSWSNANLWDSDKAPKGTKGYELYKCRTWFTISKLINRLNKIVDLYNLGKLEEMEDQLNEILNMSEKNTSNQEASLLAKERIGDLWDLLSETTQKMVSNAVAITEGSIPQRDKTAFAKGLVAGSCLNWASYTLSKKANRKFDPGSGMHLSQLRGSNLSKEFTRASTLAENYNRGKHGENKVYPLPSGSLIFFKAMEKDSLNQEFNNGLVCGFGLRKLDSDEHNNDDQNN